MLLFTVTASVLVVASWPLALVSLAALASTWWALRRFHRDSTLAYARYAQDEADVTAAVGELVDARDTLQAAGATAFGLDRVALADASLLSANDAALRADNRLSVIGFWQLVALAVVVTVGGLLAATGQASAGVVATFVLALGQVFGPVESLGWLYGEAQQARANLARLLQLLDLPVAFAAGPAPDGPGELVLHDVRFGYAPGVPVLHDVTLRLRPGDHVALVGRPARAS